MSIFGQIKKNPFKDGMYCLNYILENWDVDNSGRYEAFDLVILEASKFEDPLHYLACAYAHHYSKADHRIKAIEYFEKYLSNPKHIERFPLKMVYYDLAKDYEAECDFDNAEKYYQLSISQQKPTYNQITKNYEIAPATVALGRLYLKMSTQKAVDYWTSLMQRDEYKKGNSEVSGFRRHVDVEYKKALEKHQKGYVYKPRKK